MNHIMTFKSLWLSLQLPLTIIVPLHLITVLPLWSTTLTLVVSDARTFLKTALTCAQTCLTLLLFHVLTRV